MMSDLIIFIVGCIVLAMTLAAVVVIGISEGRDPQLSGRQVDGKAIRPIKGAG